MKNFFCEDHLTKITMKRNEILTLRKKATNGIRTHDLSLTKRVLYQLSYSGDRCYSRHLFQTQSAF